MCVTHQRLLVCEQDHDGLEVEHPEVLLGPGGHEAVVNAVLVCWVAANGCQQYAMPLQEGAHVLQALGVQVHVHAAIPA